MDFGRKGDNKRAMNLMWKSGMSLKQAWKVVKGKSKPKRKIPAKRNCFGALAGVCPQGYEINPVTGRMRKICEFGRNHQTGKCLKGPSVIKAAPVGYEYNVNTGKYRKICEYGRDIKTGRCLPMPRTSGIKEGYEINPETGRLRKICLYGRNISGRCYGRPMDQSVPPRMGYEYAPDGRLRKICLYGRDPMSGRCMGKPRLGPVGIPEGYEINPATRRYRQVCPDGYVRNSRGRCVQVKLPIQFDDAIEDLYYEKFPMVPYTVRSQSSSRLSPSCLINPFNPGCFDTKEPHQANLNPFNVVPDDDLDPFSVFFGKKRKYKARPRTRRSCFGSCSSCDMYN